MADETQNKTTEERLAEARNALHRLLVDNNAITSQGANGISLTRNIAELRNYIKDLEQQLSQESGSSMVWETRAEL